MAEHQGQRGSSGRSTLTRTTFKASRFMDLFSEKQLPTQIRSPSHQWPLALTKELMDKALDACEAAGIPPKVDIKVEPDAIIVRDNGPGLPVETLKRPIDYAVRISDKAHYVSPSRGQLGNALKCVWTARARWYGERVELNAMNFRECLDCLEAELREPGVAKMIPDPVVLAKACRRAVRLADVQQAIDVVQSRDNADIEIPVDQAGTIRERLADKPLAAWDDVVADLARQSKASSANSEGAADPALGRT